MGRRERGKLYSQTLYLKERPTSSPVQGLLFFVMSKFDKLGPLLSPRNTLGVLCDLGSFIVLF
jgi:hypothetical protein